MGKAWLDKLQSREVCIFDQSKVKTFRALHEAYAASQPPRLHLVETDDVHKWFKAEQAGLLECFRGSCTALAEFEEYCPTGSPSVNRSTRV